jgi:hypothetical protein
MLIAEPTISTTTFSFALRSSRQTAILRPARLQEPEQLPAKTTSKKLTSVSFSVFSAPEIINREMKRSQQPTQDSDYALHALQAAFVLLHAIFKLRQTPRLSDPEQRIHLVLQHTQIRKHLSFKFGQVLLLSACQPTGRSINTALEKRE